MMHIPDFVINVKFITKTSYLGFISVLKTKQICNLTAIITSIILVHITIHTTRQFRTSYKNYVVNRTTLKRLLNI